MANSEPAIDLRDPWRIEIAPRGTDLYHQASVVEASVFTEYFGNSQEDLAAAYEPYASTSELTAVLDGAGNVAGFARFGWSTPETVSLSFADIAKSPFEVDVTAFVEECGGHELFLDVYSMGAAPGYRSRDLPIVGAALMAATFYQSRRRRLPRLVGIIDTVALEIFRTVYNAPWRALPGAKSAAYMGSPESLPCETTMAEAAAGAVGDLWELVHGAPQAVNVSISEALLDQAETIDLRRPDSESANSTVAASNPIGQVQ